MEYLGYPIDIIDFKSRAPAQTGPVHTQGRACEGPGARQQFS